MSSVSASSNSASVVKTTGTVPERVSAPLPGAVPAGATASVQQNSKPRDKIEESVKPTKEAVEFAAKRIESYVKESGRELSFSVDEASGHRVVRVTDSTGELIRQMPSDETLRIAKSLDYMTHSLVSQKA